MSATLQDRTFDYVLTHDRPLVLEVARSLLARTLPTPDVTEAAPTAGLSQTSSISAGADWSGARLVAPKSSRKR